MSDNIKEYKGISRRDLIKFGLTAAAGFPLLNATKSHADSKNDDDIPVKNLIIMIPDGMGYAHMSAAQAYLSTFGKKLSFMSYPVVGSQITYCNNNFVPESAAVASSWFCGGLFDDGAISWRDGNPAVSIFNTAGIMGKKVGIVTTDWITGATPAAGYANCADRKCYSTILDQLINNQYINIAFGGGTDNDSGSCTDSESISDLENKLKNNSLFLKSKADLESSLGYSGKTIGMFSDNFIGTKNPELFWLSNSDTSSNYTQPTLAEMTLYALLALDNPNGFVLMVEGQLIDNYSHTADLPTVIAEIIGFDAAVRVVDYWASMNEKRKSQTLTVIMPDHETGGLSLQGPDGLLSVRQIPDPNWGPKNFTVYNWTRHSYSAVPILAKGARSNLFRENMDMISVYPKFLRAIGYKNS